MCPGFGQHFSKALPHRVAGGVAHQHAVLNQPGLLAAPKGPDRRLDAIFLHVGSADQEQTALRHRADAVVLSALDQSLPVRGFAFLDPGFTQLGVLEGLDGSGRSRLFTDGGFPRSGDLTPRTPAHRAV
ncbi:MAG: hypothetical protein BWZ07_02229 [Alphaproteobacteria bacterium ADurb.BinA280]|nr:MAG: hypothetical protein BWZ07_02229 [Alphaproteobacteria bacterium ADurb.BinA280]